MAQHAQVIERMDLARDHLRERLHARALHGVERDQARLREARVEVLDDRERLQENRAVVVDHGNRAVRILRDEVGLTVIALRQIQRDRLVLDAFEIQRDPHAKRRRAAEEGVELHRFFSGSAARRASSRRSGVPTSIHTPSWNTAAQHPARDRVVEHGLQRPAPGVERRKHRRLEHRDAAVRELRLLSR